MNVTIEWIDNEGAYIVSQDGEFIGDFTSLKFAALFALGVTEHSGGTVTLVSVRS